MNRGQDVDGRGGEKRNVDKMWGEGLWYGVGSENSNQFGMSLNSLRPGKGSLGSMCG